jgi:hypothetical protein
MSRCKVPETLRNKAYLEGTLLMKGEGNAADGLFSSAFQAVGGTRRNGGSQFTPKKANVQARDVV